MKKKFMKMLKDVKDWYEFDYYDIATFLTLMNVSCALGRWHYAPIIGIINALFCLFIGLKHKAHFNVYLTQVLLIVLNIYFLSC